MAISPKAKHKNGKKIPLADQAYNVMKWEILTMKLRPGSIHNEEQLGKLFGFGRSPIHLALIRLEIDGLVEIIPRKGILIRSVTYEDIKNVLEARIPLEVAMVKLAVERALDKELKAIKKLLERGPALIKNLDLEGFMVLDQDFHQALSLCAHNNVLAETLEVLHHRSSILWYVNISGEEDYKLVQKEHESILKAVVDRDAEKAEQAVSDHLSHFLKSNNRIVII